MGASVVDSVGRMFLCARCREPVVLCSRCDRGNRYCGDACSTEARRDFVRDAGRRYQTGSGGRAMHAARSRRWRLRRKAKAAADSVDERTVTHHGSPVEPVELPSVVTPSLSITVIPTAPEAAAQPPRRVCPRCACPISPFVRQRFARKRYPTRPQRSIGSRGPPQWHAQRR